jgi:hypothetical protein
LLQIDSCGFFPQLSQFTYALNAHSNTMSFERLPEALEIKRAASTFCTHYYHFNFATELSPHHVILHFVMSYFPTDVGRRVTSGCL